MIKHLNIVTILRDANVISPNNIREYLGQSYHFS